jgi:hypothetical protein
MTKVTYICCSAKKKVVTYFILFLYLFLLFSSFCFNAFFGRFVTRGVQKHNKNLFSNLFSKKSIWAHHKKCGFVFVLFFLFFPSVVWFDLVFIAFLDFGRFVTRGVQTRDKKNRAKMISACKKKKVTTAAFYFLFFAALLGFQNFQLSVFFFLGDLDLGLRLRLRRPSWSFEAQAQSVPVVPMRFALKTGATAMASVLGASGSDE